ncbi:hypothetical protein ACFLZZ_01855 [Nanoarchaeota archaeon]
MARRVSWKSVERIVDSLKKGGVIIHPSEYEEYCISCLVDSVNGVGKIREMKKYKPITGLCVVFPSLDKVREYTSINNAQIEKIENKFKERKEVLTRRVEEHEKENAAGRYWYRPGMRKKWIENNVYWFNAPRKEGLISDYVTGGNIEITKQVRCRLAVYPKILDIIKEVGPLVTEKASMGAVRAAQRYKDLDLEILSYGDYVVEGTNMGRFEEKEISTKYLGVEKEEVKESQEKVVK